MMSIVEEINKPNELKVVFKAIGDFTITKNVDFIEIKVTKIA